MNPGKGTSRRARPAKAEATGRGAKSSEAIRKAGTTAQPSQRAPRQAHHQREPGGAQQERRWSCDVTERSNALDLEEGVFTRAPKDMARSLKRSAEQSSRRKASPFQSAMSMLTFFENRAGRRLAPERRRALEQAKDELRRLYGRPPKGTAPA
ncbi:DUF3175 domain-containing protein [Myxococcus sp. Y35]|uniref:DUF3175 domain-containing protein n=1 Tax=Pseudomyxococcus flavus TaxID=3115648 RepID=UPI003CE6D54F